MNIEAPKVSSIPHITLGVQPELQESIESPVLAEVGMSFDAIEVLEDGSKRSLIIEMNGMDSGITGMLSLPEGMLSDERRAAIERRMSVGTKHIEHKKAYNAADAASATAFAAAEPPEVLKRLRDVAAQLGAVYRQSKLFEHAPDNKPFFERITSDKSLQPEFFDPEYTPPSITDESQIPSRNLDTTLWIVKPKSEKQGSGITIVTSRELRSDISFRASKGKRKAFWDNYVVQQLGQSVGSEYVNEREKPRTPGTVRPASMRVLVDFVLHESGAVRIKYLEAYQRVGKLAPEDIGKKQIMRNGLGEVIAQVPISKRDVYVVNTSRGAEAAPATDAELARVMPGIIASIEKLCAGYMESLTQE